PAEWATARRNVQCGSVHEERAVAGTEERRRRPSGCHGGRAACSPRVSAMVRNPPRGDHRAGGVPAIRQESCELPKQEQCERRAHTENRPTAAWWAQTVRRAATREQWTYPACQVVRVE